MPIVDEALEDCVTGISGEENTFRMVIAYEDQFALGRAEKLQSQLARRCNDELDISGSAWNFSLLGDPRMRRKAAQDAAMADMIVIAIGEDGQLPAFVTTWIKSLRAQKQEQQRALVILIEPMDETPDRSYGMAAALRHLAEASGMDFFCNLDDYRVGKMNSLLNDYREMAA